MANEKTKNELREELIIKAYEIEIDYADLVKKNIEVLKNVDEKNHPSNAMDVLNEHIRTLNHLTGIVYKLEKCTEIFEMQM